MMMMIVLAPVVITSCPPPYPCKIDAVIADAEDCDRYYRCVSSPGDDSRWMSQQCPPDRRFDYLRSACLPAVGVVNCHPKCSG